MLMKRLLPGRRQIIGWLPMAWVITILVMLVFVAIQQTIRHQANQPQAAIALELSNQLSSGTEPASLLSAGNSELNQTLNSFAVIYDAQHKPIAGNVNLDGKLPDFPAGALDYSLKHGEHRVTWQPNSALRIASVIRPYSYKNTTGFVVVGRSLQESEAVVSLVGKLALISWLGALLGSLELKVLACEWKK